MEVPAMHQTTNQKAFGRICCCPLRFVMWGADVARLDTPVCDVASPLLHGQKIYEVGCACVRYDLSGSAMTAMTLHFSLYRYV